MIYTTEAVSYTHLDVYKRQDFRRTSTLHRSEGCGGGYSPIKESVSSLCCYWTSDRLTKKTSCFCEIVLN